MTHFHDIASLSSDVIESQTIYTGHTFNGNYANKYQNAPLQCDNKGDCSISCPQDYSCLNSTVNCPADYGCSISCLVDGIVQYVCREMTVNWVPGNTNSIACHPNECEFQYPPPINHYTSYTVNCAEDYICWGTRIICPEHAACSITCGGFQSCNNVYVQCPSTATCSIDCSGIMYFNMSLHMNFT